jgi:hypothetical protein
MAVILVSVPETQMLPFPPDISSPDAQSTTQVVVKVICMDPPIVITQALLDVVGCINEDKNPTHDNVAPLALCNSTNIKNRAWTIAIIEFG